MHRAPWLLSLLLSALVGCEGSLAGPRPELAPPAAPVGGGSVAPAPPTITPEGDTPMTVGIDHSSLGLRRLTREEYGNTVEDLLGIANAQSTLLDDVPRARFSNNMHGLNVSQAGVEAYAHAADTIAAQAIPTLRLPMGCVLTSLSNTCFEQFLGPFLKRAFRRPPSTEELDRFTGLWTAVRADFAPRESLEAVLAAVLQSPAFLYRREAADQLDRWELASRMSYLVWASMPDEELLTAAADGSLLTPAGRAAQFERLWQAPRARPALRRFAAQWLGLEHGAVSRKDATVLAGTGPNLQHDLEQEFALRFEKTLLADTGSLAQFLAGKRAWLNPSLATLYGLPSPDAGTSVTWMQCATEHGTCTFQGTRQVRYGTADAFVTRTLSDGTSCDNTVFETRRRRCSSTAGTRR